MVLRIATENLFWKNTATEHSSDIEKSKPLSDFICFQEAGTANLAELLGTGWNSFKPSDEGNDLGLGWRTNKVKIRSKGTVFLAQRNSGNVKYRCAWAKVTVDTKKFIIGTVHMPYGQAQEADPGVYDRCVDSLVQWWKKQTEPLVIGGDWNKQLEEDPGNLSTRLPAKWQGALNPGIDGFLYSEQLKLGKSVVIKNVDLASDHPVVIVPLETSATSTPDPSNDPDQTQGSTKTSFRVVSANIRTKLSVAQVQEDVHWIINNFDPDIICTQETAGYQKILKSQNGYGYSIPQRTVPRSVRHNGILFKKSKFTPVGHKVFLMVSEAADPRISSLWLNMAHLHHKQSDSAVYAFSQHLIPNIGGQKETREPLARQSLEKMAKIVSEYAGKPDSFVFWAGDFNYDVFADVNHYNRIWRSKGLVDVYDDVGAGRATSTQASRTIDFVGRHSGDKRVGKARVLRISPPSMNSDHDFVLAVYPVAGVSDGGGVGTEVPGDDETPTPEPGQKFEFDSGHDESIDHTDCCNGTETP